MSFVWRWAERTDLYAKRAAFALLAQLALRDQALDDDELEPFLQLIFAGAEDPRRHVRQAVSWALRAIGKRNASCHERALAVALELIEGETTARRWVGRHALRELQTLVKVPERTLLLTSKSKMGRKTVRARARRARAAPTPRR